MRLFSLRLWIVFALLTGSAEAYAQEQYRSRMYIDMDVAPTENVSMSVGELEKNLGSLQDASTRASAERFLAQHFAGSKDYDKAAQYIEKALQNPAITPENKRDMLGQLARMALLQKNYDKAASAIQISLPLNSRLVIARMRRFICCSPKCNTSAATMWRAQRRWIKRCRCKKILPPNS